MTIVAGDISGQSERVVWTLRIASTTTPEEIIIRQQL